MTVATGRGRLWVSDRVVAKIAAAAAASVPDVGGPPGRGRRGFGRSRPSVPEADADVRSGSARLLMTMSVTYPASVADVVEAVRAKVSADVAALTGLRVAHVDVEVPALSPRRAARLVETGWTGDPSREPGDPSQKR